MPAHVLQHIFLDEFQHKLYCDSNASCRATATYLFKPSVILKDVASWKSVSHIRDLDFFWHSPCCYDYTSNAKQRGYWGGGTRSKLILHSLRYIVRAKPKVVGFEQVHNIIFKKHKWLIKWMKKILRQKGYLIKSGVLDSSHFGNPQRRRRFFMIGVRSDVAVAPMKWPKVKRGSTSSETEALLDPQNAAVDFPMRLPPFGQQNSIEPNRQRRLVLQALAKLKSQAKASCCEALRAQSGKLSTAVKKSMEMKHQQRYKRMAHRLVVDIGCSMSRATFSASGVPVITATRAAGRDYWVLGRGRRISLAELFRCQGLLYTSDDVSRLPASPTQIGMMVGNSIPFQVLDALTRGALVAAGYKV